MMKRSVFFLAVCCLPLGKNILSQAPAGSGLPTLDAVAPSGPEAMIVVVGAQGSDEFDGEFQGWAANWKTLAERQAWNLTMIGGAQSADASVPDRDLLQRAIEGSKDAARLWIVLLGHGTSTRNVAKFNLVGPDVSAKELAAWLKDSPPVAVIDCSSASALFLTDVASQERVVVTATRSGSEINYSRFGKFLAAAVNDPANDIDHDQEVSLLEAFLAASSETERFYRDDARLTTEHALIDDNGDRTGTGADFYRGIRPSKDTKDGKPIDGAQAARMILWSSPEMPKFPADLERQRQNLEQEIDRLRQQKSLLPSEVYFNQLELLVLELAKLYDQAEREPGIQSVPEA